MNDLLLNEAIEGAHRGWCYTPLRTDMADNPANGKMPAINRWQRKAPPTLQEITDWVATGYNLGVRTGNISKLVVIDFDGDAIGKLNDWPETATVQTGNGFHLYYMHDSGGWICNSNGKIAKGIDVRGDGGQVVAVGSVHMKTGAIYQWAEERTPGLVGVSPLPIEMLPQETVDIHAVDLLRRQRMKPQEIAEELAIKQSKVASHLQLICERRGIRYEGDDPFEPTPVIVARPQDKLPRPPDPNVRIRRRAAAYLDSMPPAIAGAGGHNKTLEAACMARRFGLGFDDILHLLEQYNARCEPPWTTNELRHKVSEAIKLVPPHEVGIKAKEHTEIARPIIASAIEDESQVPIPGPHYEHPYIREIDFCATVLDRIPDNEIYRRDTIVGQLNLDEHNEVRFSELSVEQLQIILSKHIQCVQYTKAKNEAGETFRGTTEKTIGKERARLVGAYASTSDDVRQISTIVSYPTFGPDWQMCEPGWNDNGVYFDSRAFSDGITPNTNRDEIFAKLSDLVADFPFGSESDRDNFVGLLLTAICRPAIYGPVPMHACIAPVRGSGKTLLLTRCFGQLLTGNAMATHAMPKKDEEMEKRLLSILLAGHQMLLLDNVHHFLDSASLANLTSSMRFESRVLGVSKMASIANKSIVMLTGNNISMTEELARRTITINLQPNVANPEYRSDFKHKDLPRYIDEHRQGIIECLVGMVVNWLEKDQPAWTGRPELGSFNEWSRVVGGILGLHGFTEWRGNEADWLANADPELADLATLIEIWSEYDANQPLSWLCEIAEEKELFTSRLQKGTDKARETTFGRMLSSYAGRVVECENGMWTIQQGQRTRLGRRWMIRRV